MPQIIMREAENIRYVHITPEKEVLVVCPLVGGSTIGTDNTCKSVKEMQRFFGKESNAEELRASGKHMVTRYIDSIGHDLEILRLLRPLFKHSDAEHSALIERKTGRQEHARKYVAALVRMASDNELGCLSGNYPRHPSAIRAIVSTTPTNLGSMLLCPESIDTLTRFDHMATFSLNRGGGPDTFAHQLRVAVEQGAPSGAASQNPVDRLKASAAERFGDGRFEFGAFRSALAADVSAMFGVDVALTCERGEIEGVMAMDGDEPAEDFVAPLLQLSQIDLDHAGAAASPLASVPSGCRAIVVQIYLGIVGLYARAHHGYSGDLGATLEGDARAHARAITAATGRPDPESSVLAYLAASCGVPAAVKADAARLARLLNECWLTIKDSPHFDEFCLIFPGLQFD